MKKFDLDIVTLYNFVQFCTILYRNFMMHVFSRYCGYHLNGRSQDLSSTALLPSFNAGNIKETVISKLIFKS